MSVAMPQAQPNCKLPVTAMSNDFQVGWMLKPEWMHGMLSYFGFKLAWNDDQDTLTYSMHSVVYVFFLHWIKGLYKYDCFIWVLITSSKGILVIVPNFSFLLLWYFIQFFALSEHLLFIWYLYLKCIDIAEYLHITCVHSISIWFSCIFLFITFVIEL